MGGASGAPLSRGGSVQKYQSRGRRVDTRQAKTRKHQASDTEKGVQAPYFNRCNFTPGKLLSGSLPSNCAGEVKPSGTCPVSARSVAASAACTVKS